MIERSITATNAAKAVVAIVVNAGFEFVGAWGIFEANDRQIDATQGAINAILLVYVLLTYRFSRKRVEA